MVEGPGADSEEKHEPVSDIDTAAADSLKVLDLKRPIREADIERQAKPAESVENDPTATSAVPIECASLSCHDAMAREGLRRISPNVTSSRHLTARDADCNSSARVSKVAQPEPRLSFLPRRWHP